MNSLDKKIPREVKTDGQSAQKTVIVYTKSGNGIEIPISQQSFYVGRGYTRTTPNGRKDK